MKKIFLFCTLCLIAWLQCSEISLAQAVQPENLVSKIQFYYEIAGQIAFSIMILATIVVQFFPGKKDEVSSAENKVLNLMSYFPTLWKNPRTKALENMLKDFQDE